jgi:pilus assembly protein CpaC
MVHLLILAAALLLPAASLAQTPNGAAPPAAPPAAVLPGGVPMPQAVPMMPGFIPGVAPPDPVVFRPGAALAIESGQGRIVALGRGAATVFAADPRVAEVRPASPTSLFIFGISPGRTTVAALDSNGQPVAQWEVSVMPSAFNAGAAAATLSRALPNARGLRAEPRGDGLAIIGEVQTPAEAAAAERIARGFVPEGGRVENRLTVLGQTQVNLRVRVAEVSREVTRQFGINWQAFGSFGRFGISAVTNNGLAAATNLPNLIGGSWQSGASSVDALIDALAQDRLITVLAEPNITAMSGEAASFLVGGEFPIPVGQRDNTITIEFKQYGISLAFVPTVMSQGRISLRVRPEVSELTDQGAVRLQAGNASLIVPALTVRRAETTVELGSGQSFAIAGLLSDSSRQTGRALPGAGEIPILGALFRSDRFQRNETELVIVVTPFIVSPQSDATQIRTPVDGFRVPNDVERILFFRQRGEQRLPQAGLPMPPVPGAAGFGLTP